VNSIAGVVSPRRSCSDGLGSRGACAGFDRLSPNGIRAGFDRPGLSFVEGLSPNGACVGFDRPGLSFVEGLGPNGFFAQDFSTAWGMPIR
jgi:hypothetical protein